MVKIMKNFLKFLSQESPEKFIVVKQGSYGLETYINEDIYTIDEAYKDMFIAFLEGIIKNLKTKGKKK